jgi:hypothetical protein
LRIDTEVSLPPEAETVTGVIGSTEFPPLGEVWITARSLPSCWGVDEPVGSDEPGGSLGPTGTVPLSLTPLECVLDGPPVEQAVSASNAARVAAAAVSSVRRRRVDLVAPDVVTTCEPMALPYALDQADLHKA